MNAVNSPRQFLVIATAGHVDHGKTSLVQQLTGTDTDTLAEEKARGLTINTGFAYRHSGGESQSGTTLGFVDVPGHSDFTGWTDTMRDIGVDVKNPTDEWDGDANCPFYGSLRLRGQVLEGTVSSLGMLKTITIERNNVRYMEKYERFEKRTSVLSAHLPACIGEVAIGDSVKVMECRPLSKTVSFCVIETNGGEA